MRLRKERIHFKRRLLKHFAGHMLYTNQHKHSVFSKYPNPHKRHIYRRADGGGSLQTLFFVGVYLGRSSWCGLDFAIFTSPSNFLRPEEYLKPLGFTQTQLWDNYSALSVITQRFSGCYNGRSEGSDAHRAAHRRCPSRGVIFTPDRWHMAVLESGSERKATLQLWWEYTNHSGS